MDGSLNVVNEVNLNIINNETYYLKEILKQKDKLEFIKVIEYNIDIHEYRNY